MKISLYPYLMLSFLLWSCQETGDKMKQSLNIEKEYFGQTKDGSHINIYTLTNTESIEVKIINYGAIIQSLTTPDRNNNYEDVVLGYDKLEDYINDSPYFGAIVGRYGNRIAKGKFTLDSVDYKLVTNNGANHLHGGREGFDKVVWDSKIVKNDMEVGVEMTYLSKDGEEGYPGNLQTTVIYTLNNKNELQIEYTAITDKATPVNLTHHSYFNLSGNCKIYILNHELWINANYFTPVDEGLIPSGELRPVKGTPMDFTIPTAIGARIDEDTEQLKFGLGYDHNWVLDNVDGTMKLQVSLYDPASGRLMEIYTMEPGLQFYSGNFLDGSNVGKGGKVYNYRQGLCLETQHYPDSPNKPEFPSTILRPGDKYFTKTIYRFTTK